MVEQPDAYHEAQISEHRVNISSYKIMVTIPPSQQQKRNYEDIPSWVSPQTWCQLKDRQESMWRECRLFLKKATLEEVEMKENWMQLLCRVEMAGSHSSYLSKFINSHILLKEWLWFHVTFNFFKKNSTCRNLNFCGRNSGSSILDL